MPYHVRQRDLAPASQPPEPDASLPRACVIGAGSCGLTATKALAHAGIDVDCFEAGSVVGGNWVMRNPNGISGCYETLEMNTSGPRMAFSDFPMPADYPPYPKHDQVAAYLEAYVDHFGFRDQIAFDTEVTSVAPAGDGRWSVTTRGPQGERTEVYDAVLIANGHHWDPRWPEPAYPGSFAGEQIHAHDYRSGEQLRDRDVVVVGAGNSALDIASEAGRVARSATLSQRRGQWILPKYALGRPSDQVALPGWMPWWATALRLRLAAVLGGGTASLGLPQPEHAPGGSHPVQSEDIRGALRSGAVRAALGIERLAGDRVVFTDGSEAVADLIVWAIGYRVSFPFLDPAVVSAPGNDLPLWKRTVHPDLPGLFFVGLLQPVGAVMPLAQAQGEWVAEMLTGRYLPPGQDEVRAQTAADHASAVRRFYDSPRHTMEVDFDHYLWDLRRERRRGARRAATAGGMRSRLPFSRRGQRASAVGGRAGA